jgi:hypothetical protein
MVGGYMRIDTFIKLIQDLRVNSITEEEDPNNILLQAYASPFDQVSQSDFFRVRTSSVASIVWGTGATYTAYDSLGQPYQAPSCGWYWGSGGKWSGNPQNFIFPWEIH